MKFTEPTFGTILPKLPVSDSQKMTDFIPNPPMVLSQHVTLAGQLSEQICTGRKN